MFAFDNLENITNKVVTKQSDLKVFAGNKIRLTPETITKLNLVEGRNVLILKGKDGTVVIASVDGETKQGRPVNKNREFSHENIAKALDGHHSEWSLAEEGQTHPVTGDVYFEMTKTVNGADVVAELAAKIKPEVVAEDVVDTEAISDEIAQADDRAAVLANMEEEVEVTLPQDTYEG